MERPPPRSEGPSSLADDEVELGFVSGVFGTAGEVRLHLHNPTSDLLRQPRRVVLVAPDGSRRHATLTARPGAGKRILGRIAGIDDRDGAAALMGFRVRIEKADLPAAAPDEFYVWQLEGAAVEVDGQRRGTVATIHRAGPIDILEVDIGSDSVFVPMIAAIVVGVDAPRRVVRLAPGALDE